MTKLTARELVQNSPMAFRREKAEGVNAVIQFDVTGSDVFQGYLTIKDGECTYTDGVVVNPTLTIKTPADVWVKMLMGDLNPQTAFFKRMYQAQGDMSLFMRMGQMFGDRRGS